MPDITDEGALAYRADPEFWTSEEWLRDALGTIKGAEIYLDGAAVQTLDGRYYTAYTALESAKSMISLAMAALMVMGKKQKGADGTP